MTFFAVSCGLMWMTLIPTINRVLDLSEQTRGSSLRGYSTTSRRRTAKGCDERRSTLDHGYRPSAVHPQGRSIENRGFCIILHTSCRRPLLSRNFVFRACIRSRPREPLGLRDSSRPRIAVGVGHVIFSRQRMWLFRDGIRRAKHGPHRSIVRCGPCTMLLPIGMR